MRQIVFTTVLLVVFLGVIGCSGESAPNSTTMVNVAGGSYTNVMPARLKQMLSSKDFFLVNVHTPYTDEIVQTDAWIPYDLIQQNLSKLPADKSAKIILYCSSGRMSSIAAEELVKLGYSNVWNLKGGMAAWDAAGYSLIQRTN